MPSLPWPGPRDIEQEPQADSAMLWTATLLAPVLEMLLCPGHHVVLPALRSHGGSLLHERLRDSVKVEQFIYLFFFYFLIYSLCLSFFTPHVANVLFSLFYFI